jgi:hypothetical protein
MKTFILPSAAGVSLSLLASALLASLALAGPSPQYWQQQEKIRAENAKARAATVTPAQPAAMACASCKTTRVEEFSAINVSGKYAPHHTTVGSRHECAACVGVVVTVRNRTINDMKANCAVCAQARGVATACCK